MSLLGSPLLKKPRLTRQASAHGTSIDYYSAADIYERSRDKEQKYLEENALPEWWTLERVRVGLLEFKDSFAAQYFDEAEAVSAKLGLTVTEPVGGGAGGGVAPVPRDEDDLDCAVCGSCVDDDPDVQFMDHPICGHRVCKPCMTQYCTLGVMSKEFACARCPCNCREPLTEAIIVACLSDELMQKYRLWVARKYMESSQHLRECHASGCETFIEYHNDYSTQPIICVRCNNLWCWQCGKEAHTPAACQQAAKWFSEIGSDVQDKMLASKCKKCPKCRALINIDDKVHCNHMTCVCGHHFCWLCMEPWSNHSGDFYNCNKFKEMSQRKDAKVQKAQADYNKAVEQRKFYEHCFDRYIAHDGAYQAATKHLPERVQACIERAKSQFDLSEYKLRFMKECAKELRLCRLALKWSYPYIYCMKDVSPTTFDVVVMKQAKLEKYTDLLHEAMAAIEVHPDGRVTGKSELVSIFVDVGSTQRRFNDFRTRVLEECKAINQFRLGLCETAQNNARKIKWADVELGGAAKNYDADGKWLDAQGGR